MAVEHEQLGQRPAAATLMGALARVFGDRPAMDDSTRNSTLVQNPRDRKRAMRVDPKVAIPDAAKTLTASLRPYRNACCSERGMHQNDSDGMSLPEGFPGERADVSLMDTTGRGNRRVWDRTAGLRRRARQPQGGADWLGDHPSGDGSRRRDCHFGDTPFNIQVKEEGVAPE